MDEALDLPDLMPDSTDFSVPAPGIPDPAPGTLAESSDRPVVIVADDDQSIRAYFRIALERAGFTVHVASNGRRALELARQSGPSVMLLDLHMPGLDGIDTLRSLRSEPGLRTLPVILVTGSATEADRIVALDKGADDVVIKPVSVTELVARIRAQIRARGVLTEERDAGRRYRRKLAAFLPELPRDAPLIELATTVADRLPEILDVDAVAILAFERRTTRSIAAGGVLADLFPPTRALPPDLGSEIITRAPSGPWLDMSSAGRGARDTYELAFVPFRLSSTAGLIGSLVFARATSRDQAPLSRRLGDLSDATDLIVTALRPAIEHAETTNAAILGLRSVISRRNFSIHLQPIVRLDTGDLVAVEALTRFADGVRPDVRFAEAARLGLGLALERATISAAVKAASSLPPDVALSINVSPDVLRHEPELARIIAAAGRPIIVELTEHERIDDYDAVRTAFARLGPEVRLAVDDAGSGYASLRHILSLQPAYVKLDMEWVRNIHLDPIRRSLVSGLAYFADATGCELIAEGIEAPEERQSLFALGVRLGQGFLLGRPTPTTEG